MRLNRSFLWLATIGVGIVLTGSPTLGQTMPEHAHAKAAASTSLTLAVDGKATTLSVAELQAMPQKTLMVHNGHTKKDETYTGVALDGLLTKYGAPFDKAGEKKIFHSYVRVEGTDHYFVLYSGAEVQSTIHNADVIVAIAMDGKPLGEDGLIKLVASGEKRPARWVRNLSSITLVTVE
ncbi:MAG: hypothetical protein JWQ42_1069 [Edaphobacter sp.]|nr:hypothetical protein [Edaphobacter sp.]